MDGITKKRSNSPQPSGGRDAKRRREEKDSSSASSSSRPSTPPPEGQAIDVLGQEARIIASSSTGATVWMPRGMLDLLRSLKENNTSSSKSSSPLATPTFVADPARLPAHLIKQEQLDLYLTSTMRLEPGIAKLLSHQAVRCNSQEPQQVVDKFFEFIDFGERSQTDGVSKESKNFSGFADILRRQEIPEENLEEAVFRLMKCFDAVLMLDLPMNIRKAIVEKILPNGPDTDSTRFRSQNELFEIERIHLAVCESLDLSTIPRDRMGQDASDLVSFYRSVASQTAQLEPKERDAFYVSLLNVSRSFDHCLIFSGPQAKDIFNCMANGNLPWSEKNKLLDCVAGLTSLFAPFKVPKNSSGLSIGLVSSGTLSVIDASKQLYITYQDVSRDLDVKKNVDANPYLLSILTGLRNKSDNIQFLKSPEYPRFKLNESLIEKERQGLAMAVISKTCQIKLVRTLHEIISRAKSDIAVRPIYMTIIAAVKLPTNVFNAVAALAMVVGTTPSFRGIHNFLSRQNIQSAEKLSKMDAFFEVLRACDLPTSIDPRSSQKEMLEFAKKLAFLGYQIPLVSVTQLESPTKVDEWYAISQLMKQIKGGQSANRRESLRNFASALANPKSLKFLEENQRDLAMLLSQNERTNAQNFPIRRLSALKELIISCGVSAEDRLDKDKTYRALRPRVLFFHPDKRGALGDLSEEHRNVLTKMFLFMTQSMEVLKNLPTRTYEELMQ